MGYELIIVLALVVFSKTYYTHAPLPIISDGKGYYDYLPAAFIYHDLEWHFLDTLVTEHYVHGDYSGIYNLIGGKKVNQYFIGTSIVMLPFFGLACVYDFITGGDVNGYSNPFQKAISIAALFYLWLGLFYLKRFLFRLQMSKSAVLITLFVLSFATFLLYYAYFQSSFSHIYSFAAISAFLYFSYRYYETQKAQTLLLAAFSIGIIFLIRPTNAIVAMIVLFYFDSLKAFGTFVKEQVLNSPYLLMGAVLLVVGIVFIQPLVWHAQTGHFFVDSYKTASFNFSSPEVFNLLFSYRKGLFVYTPILFPIFIGGSWVFWKKKEYYRWSVLIALLSLVIYILSSWQFWSYGMSFGMRAFVEYLPVAAIFLAVLANTITNRQRVVLIVISVLFMIVNLVQIDQYNRYILHWADMTKESYWSVFMKTNKKYEGLLWQQQFDYQKNQVVETTQEAPQAVYSKNSWNEILNVQQPTFFGDLKFDLVHVKADINIKEGNPIIYLAIDDAASNNLIWQEALAFRGIKQNVFYRENNAGEASYFFKVDLPENFHHLKIGFVTNDGEMVVNNYTINFVQTQ